ncbi:MAG: phenylalanyl-tRNA synthetase beta chain [Chloroflexi bacterium]|jgi:phenylalanyl-tRNA synthetase beta chain|nr:MAG: phenylalanyl-tRNA synthetase beta chain [Chloroflexota bacterium]
MRVPLSWLKDYVPVTLAPKDLAHRLTLAGLEVGEVEIIGGWDRDRVVVGLVTGIEPHPGADRLRLATVELGQETWTVVCGAPNVAEGQKIAFAKEGARLYNAHEGKVEDLKRAKIRGVESAGMVCSELELGLGDSHEGILVLPPDTSVGTPLADLLGDVVLDIEVTPNRPDCLSILGIAHEVAALTGQRVTDPDLSYSEAGDPIEDQAKVVVEDADLCPRYTASLIRGVSIGPSPQWMQDRLVLAGQRPINNVVDVTNYVMLEYGQPLHAFDFNTVRQQTVVVRPAKNGETLRTIDGEEHKLSSPMLLIADPERGVGLAGVMGGANSEMTEATTDVLVESANFHPTNTRLTARGLGIRTEASLRFEKGLGPELPPLALRRATQLILELAGGTAARGTIDAYPGRSETPSILLTMERVGRVLGTPIEQAVAQETLEALGFNVVVKAEGSLEVTPPYWRTDIAIPEDLVEEVARTTGYDRIPATPLTGALAARRPQPWRDLREELRDLLVEAGMQETISYTLVNGEALEALEMKPDGSLKVANPMSQEQEYLRTSLRASLLSSLAANLRRSPEAGLRLFEIGRVYTPREGDLPLENEKAVGVLAGPRATLSWGSVGEETLDFFDAKGVIEAALAQLSTTGVYEPATDSVLHPGRTASILVNGAQVGVIGEVHPGVLERFDVPAERVALFELDIEALLAALPEGTRRFESISRFPDTLRDLALVVNKDVSAQDVRKRIEGHPLVHQAVLFDVYEGERIDPDKRSLAYRVVLRAPNRTLTSEEVSQALAKTLRILQNDLGATLRG